MSPATIQRHVGLVCAYLNKPAPKKVSKTQIERGKKELLAISGLGSTAVEKLFGAGIIDGESLLAADPAAVSSATGITEQKIRDYQKILKRKKETAVIEL